VFLNTGAPVEDWRWKPTVPCTAVSIFEQGCIEKGLSYFEGGPVYNLLSPHIGGLPDVANSLYAIKKLVFEDKILPFFELMSILRNNWQDSEYLRQYAMNKYVYFGNDNDEADNIAKKIISDFATICDELDRTTAYKVPAGVSTFGRQLEWSCCRAATPYGKTAHEVLAGNFSPTPGTDREGATAIIKSYCKADLRRTVSGAALDIKLLPSAVNSENGIAAIVSLIKGFVALGGHFMQLDIADSSLLKEAQEHPENYRHLSVRVSGWNARFVTLNREWQDMIIAQTGSKL
ncbi:MAG: pyruvate formate lyase family protein, partial [Eubacteriales bacterium]